MEEISNDLTWLSQGLRFKCTGCGKCCTGSPGYVFLSTTDLDQFANYFSLTIEEFTLKYTHIIDNQLVLIDKPGSGDCIFLNNKQCSAYEARPVQCRTFPWWIHNIREEKDWKEAAKHCEGIEHPDAPIVSSLHIQEQCLTYLDNLLEQNFYP